MADFRAFFHTFAEDACLEVGHILLAKGSKSYAHRMALIGEWNTSFARMNVKEVLDKMELNPKALRKSDRKAKPLPFEPIDEHYKTFMNEWTNIRSDLIIENILQSKAKSFKTKKIDPEEFKAKLKSTNIKRPQELVDIGYLDGLSTYEEIRKETVGDIKDYVVDISAKNTHTGYQNLMLSRMIAQ